MRKKTMIILFLLSIVVFIACIIDAAFLGVLQTPAISSCSATSSCTLQDLTKAPAFLMAVIVMVITLIASFVLGIIVVISVLVKQAKQQQWGWFVCTLCFGFFPLFGAVYISVYLIVVPERPQFMTSH